MKLSGLDLGVVLFYFIFLASIGWITRRFVSNTSDYFRGGGQMLWWMTGASAFMTQFSAWSFTGAASKAYTDGPIILTIFFANGLGFFICFLYFAPKMRQLRVITPVQAIRQRYGRASEQFFTWVFMPTNILYAGIWLNGLAVFLSAVFGFPLHWTIIGTGLIVLFNSTLGGSWAVVSSDFMQTLILMMIAVVCAFFALDRIGGMEVLITEFPAQSILGNNYSYPILIITWMFFIFVKQFVSTNNVMESSRYLTAKDSKNAAKAGLMASVLMIFGPILWFIPPMAAAITHPNIAENFPNLPNATEAAYVAIALETLPTGMIGLLLAGMFAATISSMDSGLNRNAGIFTKNFYLPILRPHASEGEQMIVSKSITIFLGLLIIGAALFYSSLKDLGLFDLMLQFSSLVGLPVTIPLVLALVIKKTPDWAAWSAVIFGFFLSYLCKFHFNGEWLSATYDLGFTRREISEYDTLIGIAANCTLLPLWFFVTKLFYREPAEPRKTELEDYWRNQATPVTADENESQSDGRQGKVLGGLAGAYGGFVMLLALLPNPLLGRLAFLFAGGMLGLIGFLIYRSTRAAAAAPEK